MDDAARYSVGRRDPVSRLWPVIRTRDGVGYVVAWAITRAVARRIADALNQQRWM